VRAVLAYMSVVVRVLGCHVRVSGCAGFVLEQAVPVESRVLGVGTSPKLDLLAFVVADVDRSFGV